MFYRSVDLLLREDFSFLHSTLFPPLSLDFPTNLRRNAQLRVNPPKQSIMSRAAFTLLVTLLFTHVSSPAFGVSHDQLPTEYGMLPTNSPTTAAVWIIDALPVLGKKITIQLAPLTGGGDPDFSGGTMPSEMPSEHTTIGAMSSENATSGGAMPSEHANHGKMHSENSITGAMPSEYANHGKMHSEYSITGAMPSEHANHGKMHSENSITGAMPSEHANHGKTHSKNSIIGAMPSEHANQITERCIRKMRAAGRCSRKMRVTGWDRSSVPEEEM